MHYISDFSDGFIEWVNAILYQKIELNDVIRLDDDYD